MPSSTVARNSHASHRPPPSSPAAAAAAPNSPIFPSEIFSPVDLAFQVPENEIVTTNSVSLAIVLAEPLLFLRGFTPQEYHDRSPSILRGTLIVKALKPTKIKAITLAFKGTARTEWPEGIPPKKQETSEVRELHSHTWPFFNASFPSSDFTSGANMVRFQKDNTHRVNLALDSFDFPSNNSSSSSLSTLNHEDPGNDTTTTTGRYRSTSGASDLERPVFRKSHHARSSSNPNNHNMAGRSESTESTSAIRAFADRLRRAASPSPSPSLSPRPSTSLSSTAHPPPSSKKHPSQRTASPSRDMTPAIVHSLVPRRSFSKDEPIETETQTKGYRTFEPGEYYYNFELPIPQSLPETLECNFGSVKYCLDASVEKPGAFRTKVSGSKHVSIIRAPSDNNLEISEPIAIAKSWEDQLYYEIVISGKAFPIGTRIPIAFKLTPLAKVELHRIRVYITENCEYYCKNKRVHRIEPTKRFLLEEVSSKDGLSGNLLLELAPSGSYSASAFEGISVENEMTPLIPTEFPLKKEILHPNSTYDNIKVHHWIKIVLRISRRDPTIPATDQAKRKHYEISIDSPIHLLDTHCTNSNVYLPPYIDPVSRRPSVASHHRPIPTGELAPPSSDAVSRPIHFLRKPSVAPPPFDADESPPPVPDLPATSEEDDDDDSPGTTGSSAHSAVSSASSVSSGDSAESPSRALAQPDAPPPTYELATKDSTQSYVDRFNMYQEMRRRSREENERTLNTHLNQLRRNMPSTIVEAPNTPLASPATPTGPLTTVAVGAPFTPTTPVARASAASTVDDPLYVTPGSLLGGRTTSAAIPRPLASVTSLGSNGAATPLGRSVTSFGSASGAAAGGTVTGAAPSRQQSHAAGSQPIVPGAPVAPPITAVLTAPEMSRSTALSGSTATAGSSQSTATGESSGSDGSSSRGSAYPAVDQRARTMSSVSSVDIVDQDPLDPDDPLSPAGRVTVPPAPSSITSPAALAIAGRRQGSYAPAPAALQRYNSNSSATSSAPSSAASSPVSSTQPSPALSAASSTGPPGAARQNKYYASDVETLLTRIGSIGELRAPLLGSFSGPSGPPAPAQASQTSVASAASSTSSLASTSSSSLSSSSSSSSGSMLVRTTSNSSTSSLVTAIPGHPSGAQQPPPARQQQVGVQLGGGRVDSVSGDIGLRSASDLEDDNVSLASTPSLWIV